jgi:hypothetical protein
VRFFFDNCISSNYVDALRPLTTVQDVELRHLQQVYPEGVPDIEWIRALQADGDWIIVSGDLRITRSRPERAAWMECGFTTFFCDEAWSRASLWPQFLELVRWWPDIVVTARRYPHGYGFKMQSKTTKMQQIFPLPTRR